MPALDLKGKRFGRLIVLERAQKPNANNAMWRCRCDCGGETIAAASNIAGGTTRSCGCLAKEAARKLLQDNRYTFLHGKSHTVEHSTWMRMIDRCHNPSNSRYAGWGGRGISVCPEWRNDFMAFLNHVGKKPSPKHSIDRIDNDRGYGPGNCRWALPYTQMRNSRLVVFVEIDGIRLCVSDWCIFLQISKGMLYIRAKRRRVLDVNLTIRESVEAELKDLYSEYVIRRSKKERAAKLARFTEMANDHHG